MFYVAQNGGVAGRRWQPFEAHIPFMLQLKIDFNLAGMGFLRLARANFRPPLPPSGARRGAHWCTSPLVVTYEPGGSSARPAFTASFDHTIGSPRRAYVRGNQYLP